MPSAHSPPSSAPLAARSCSARRATPRRRGRRRHRRRTPRQGARRHDVRRRRGACLLLEQSYRRRSAPRRADAPPTTRSSISPTATKARQAVASPPPSSSSRRGARRQAADASRAPPRPARRRRLRPAPPPSPLRPAPCASPLPPVATDDDESPTRIGDFMDTRLSWTFGDDDILHQTGQAFPLSPDASIGDRKQYRLFFDNLNSRFSGRENMTHLALYKKMPGFIHKLDTEASLVIRFDIGQLAQNTGNLNQALYDAGSFIRAVLSHGGEREGKAGLGLTLWPLDTDRFRLGYLYDISWGGTAASSTSRSSRASRAARPAASSSTTASAGTSSSASRPRPIMQVAADARARHERRRADPHRPDELRLPRRRRRSTSPRTSASTSDGGYFQQGKFDLPDVVGQERLHVRRLGPRPPPPQGHADPAVDRLLALPKRSEQAAGHLQARDLHARQDDLGGERRVHEPRSRT